MKQLRILSIFLLITWGTFAQNQFDLVIVGGNPGGIMAAIAAARQGKTSVILERTNYIGGLPANGLGATDIATRNATTGLFSEFTTKIKQYYIHRYGENSQQVKDCSDGFHFEPSVAASIYQDMLNEYKDKITILLMRQFDAESQNISLKNGKIEYIYVLNRENQKRECYQGNIFIDATYEGDLAAAAGVPFRVGRESKNEFGEPGAGRAYEYWKSQPAEGSTGEPDNAVQAYNYRLCLTNDPKIRVPFTKPERYNREEYVSLIEDVWTGRNTWATMKKVTNEMLENNRSHIAQGNPTKLPGDSWGINKLSSLVKLPNQKTDGNNQHGVFISTDLPEENWPWPTSSWEWRDKFAIRLKEYTLGLFWFAQHDQSLPKHFREEISKWGFAKDEYQDNEHFPRQVYVREGRRFEGAYFFTAKDALPTEPGKRPPLHTNSITASHYALDSHAARKRETGRAHLDGFISYPTAVYTVPLGVILPKEINNLLMPVPVSGSHIGFSTLRMEPCWMALGQAAGITASLAIDYETNVRDISIDKLQEILIKQKATLIYYRDVQPENPHFPLVQYMGLRGYLPEWEVNLQDTIDKETLQRWSALCGFELKAVPGKTTRLEVLTAISEQKITLKDAFNNKFYIGVALNRGQFSGNNTKAEEIIKTQFNAIVAENCMKSMYLQPEKDKFFFDDADKFVAFGEKNHMYMTGHTLIWHSQTPRWFFVDDKGNKVSREILIERMKKYIYTVVGRYKGKIKGWDVVNEAILDNGKWRDSQFYQIIGEDFIKLAFQFAHEADPDAELYYNDYSMAIDGKRDSVLKMVKSLQKQGVRIDGIGMQGHIGMDTPSISDFEKSILAFSNLGIKVMITELDLSVLPNLWSNMGANISETAEYQEKMNPYPNAIPRDVELKWEERYLDFFKLFFKYHDRISRVTLWGISDADSWKNNFPIKGRTDYPLLFDRNYNPKSVIQKIMRIN